MLGANGDPSERCAIMCGSMSDEAPSDVLGSLPRTRPHRRSQRRASRPAAANGHGVADETAPAVATKEAKAPARRSSAAEKTSSGAKARAGAKAPRAPTPVPPAAKRPKQTRLRQPAQPGGTPTAPRKAAPSGGADVLGTAVQAAAELAEIGLSVSARALRRAVARLPRP
jgi:hypothetical protein